MLVDRAILLNLLLFACSVIANNLEEEHGVKYANKCEGDFIVYFWRAIV